jgi:hypothetical protein
MKLGFPVNKAVQTGQMMPQQAIQLVGQKIMESAAQAAQMGAREGADNGQTATR